MVGEVELVSGREGPANAGTMGDKVTRFLFLHAQLGEGRSISASSIFSGIIKDFETGVAPDGDYGRFRGQQTGGGSREVIVGQRIFAGPQLLLDIPGVDDVVRIESAAHQVVSGAFLPRARFVDAGGVGDHHRMLPHFMLEEVEDAILLHEPRDEIEVGLAVLDAVLHRRVAAVEREVEVLKAAVLKDLLQDVANFLVVEDFAVRIAGQRPGPGNDFHLVMDEIRVGTTLRKVAYHAIEVARGVVRLRYRDGYVLADDLGKVDWALFGEQVEMEAE